MERPGYFRKYIILEQIDTGFGMERSPEGFARLEGSREGIALALQVKYLKEGELPFNVILIYDKGDDIGVFRVGTLQFISRIGAFRRFLDYNTVKSLELKPENINYILIAAEHENGINIPLAGFCRKSVHWDEAVRQRLLRKERTKEARDELKPVKDENVKEEKLKEDKVKEEKKERQNAEEILQIKTSHRSNEEPAERGSAKVDYAKLENKLKESFDQMEPFSNPRHDYVWYRVNDIAKLSNILLSCNLTIPLFANPKILVGLFKYRHLLAGFYRSDINSMNYFVLGVPAKDDADSKPFENICRWVPVQNSEFGDMTGYWLVYINLKTGEFVS